MDPKLIRSIADVTKYVPVNMTSNFNVIKPFLLTAESAFIPRIIGKAQYEALAVLFAATEEPLPTANQTRAIELCQCVITNLGYYYAVPVLNVSIGTSGIQINSNSDTKAAFQWQVEEVKNSLQELGFGAVEELLALMEDNLDDFTAYRDSDERSLQQSLVLSSAAQFSGYYNINNSRLVYQSVVYLVKRIEQQQLTVLYGSAFMQTLKATDLPEKKQQLLDNYIRPGVTLLTVAKAVIERVVTLENGLITYNFKGRTDNMRESQALSNQQVEEIQCQLQHDGNLFLQQGLDFITANVADFADYVAPPVKRSRFKATNDPKKGLFIA